MRVLDLFSGEGGASSGYHDAGFEVVGVDSNPRVGLRYPWEFHCTDALEFLDKWGHCFDAIHASPPCQAYSHARRLGGNEHPGLVARTRALLRAVGKPYIIENVPGARLYGHIELCGSMFDLGTYRHRWFECSFPISVPTHRPHDKVTTRMGRPPREDQMMHVVGHISNVEAARKAMDTPWMSGDGMSQAIPPAYTRYIGTRLLQQMSKERTER